MAEVRDEAFTRFWINFSTGRDVDVQEPEANLEGSSALVPPLLSEAKGVVLDIGPGSGSHVPLFTKHAKQIKRIYGAEPCLGLHDELKKKIAAAGLNKKYTILSCSAERSSLLSALEKSNPSQGPTPSYEIFDAIICFRVLCSVPNPEGAVSDLYKILKPGGKLIVCEHTINPWRSAKGSLVARLLQSFYQFCGWSFFVGNCNLERDMKRTLLQAAVPDGGWQNVSLQRDFEWSPLPYLSGSLVKKT
ncbi:hypothetical protein ACLMJK_005205 [Lecanora helva]